MKAIGVEADPGAVLGDAARRLATVGSGGVEQAAVALAGAAGLDCPVEDEGGVGEEVGEVEAGQAVRLRRLPVEQSG